MARREPSTHTGLARASRRCVRLQHCLRFARRGRMRRRPPRAAPTHTRTLAHANHVRTHARTRTQMYNHTDAHTRLARKHTHLRMKDTRTLKLCDLAPPSGWACVSGSAAKRTDPKAAARYSRSHVAYQQCVASMHERTGEKLHNEHPKHACVPAIPCFCDELGSFTRPRRTDASVAQWALCPPVRATRWLGS